MMVFRSNFLFQFLFVHWCMKHKFHLFLLHHQRRHHLQHNFHQKRILLRYLDIPQNLQNTNYLQCSLQFDLQIQLLHHMIALVSLQYIFSNQDHHQHPLHLWRLKFLHVHRHLYKLKKPNIHFVGTPMYNYQELSTP